MIYFYGSDSHGKRFWLISNVVNDVISTGKVDLVESKYTNIYNSNQDLTDHDLYILTIEPDDGDPAPADHIAEGILVRQ